MDKKKQDLEERKNKPLGNLTEEERNKEKNRRHMAEYRAKNKKNTRKKMSELTPEEQELRREENRRRNAIYRERHREELRAYHNARRAQMKAENPELLKELDRKNNAKAGRKQAGRKYYLLNREKLNTQNKNNPNRAQINKRYKTKKRLEKTGAVISSLIQGLLNFKGR